MLENEIENEELADGVFNAYLVSDKLVVWAIYGIGLMAVGGLLWNL